MKSNIVVKLLVICLMITLNVTLKTKTKKTETVMGFFNDLFTEGMNKNKVANVTNENNATNGVLGNWLQISSPSFQSASKYPPVILPDETEISLKVDSENYRLNDAFKEGKNITEGPGNERDFWFRLSGTHLYYSMTKTDMNLMGVIAIEQIIDAKENSDTSKYCFILDDEESNQWTLCADSKKIRNDWITRIKKNLGIDSSIVKDNDEEMPQAMNNTLTEKSIIEQKTIQPIILIPLPSKKCNEGWTYQNHGSDWSCGCSEGKEQSPIDLPKARKAVASPVAPEFKFEEVESQSPITSLDGEVISEQYIKIKHFENALRIFHPNLGKVVTIDGSVYIAEEIVFHTPAEHTIDGKRHEMEMQVVFYGQSKGDIAKQVVLSFLFHKKAGVYNKFIDDVDFFALPNPSFRERDITNNLFIPKVFYSSNDNNIPIMKPFSFYTYQGSISHPPCTERTIHYVASRSLPIANVPLELMKEAIKSQDLEEKGNDKNENLNYRNTQPVNGRTVFYYDHKKYCGADGADGADGANGTQVKKPRPSGHYEKIPKKVTEYFYVNGNEPSGLPGSFLIDEKEAKGQLP